MQQSISERLMKGSIYSFIATVALLVVGLVRSSITARLLGADNLGILSIYQDFSGLVVIILMIGIPTAVAKFVAEYGIKDREKTGRIVSTGIVFLIVTSVAGSIAFFLLSDLIAIGIYDTQVLGLLFKLSSVFLLVAVFINMGMYGILQGFHRIKTIALVNMAVGLSSLPLIYVMALYYGLVGLVVAGILSNFLNLFLVLYSIRLVLKESKIAITRNVDGPMLRTMLAISLPLLASALIMRPVFLFGNSYLFVSVGAADLGLLRIANTITTIIIVIPNAISLPLLPIASEIDSRMKDKRAAHWATISKLSMIVVLPVCVGIILWSELLIAFVFGTAFVGAAPVLGFLTVGSFFGSVSGVIYTIMIGKGKTFQLLILDIFQGAIYVVLVVLLVSTFGLMGMGYLSAIVFCVVMVVLFVYLAIKKEMVIGTVAPALTFAAIFLAASLAATILLSGLVFYAVSAVIFALMAVAMYSCLNAKDKSYIKRLIGNVLKKKS
jgi:O-antigen/teichoic acid export membrane protein